MYGINFSDQSYTLAYLALHKIKKKNIQFIHAVGLHLSVNITASVQLASFFIHTGINCLTPFINSTVDNVLQLVSIKRCLRSATSLSHPIFNSQLGSDQGCSEAMCLEN